MEEQQLVKTLMGSLTGSIILNIALAVIFYFVWSAFSRKKAILQMEIIAARLGWYESEDKSFAAISQYLESFEKLAKADTRTKFTGNDPTLGNLTGSASYFLQKAVLGTKTYSELLAVFTGWDKKESMRVMELGSFIKNTQSHVEYLVEKNFINEKQKGYSGALSMFETQLRNSFPEGYKLSGKYYQKIEDALVVKT